jgi:hypothetical protein
MAIVPTSWFYQHSIPCYHEKYLGFKCPLCGLTSSTYNLVHFNFKKALELNFVVIPLSFLVLSEIILIFRKERILKKINKYLLYTTIAGFIVIYAIRIFNYFV